VKREIFQSDPEAALIRRICLDTIDSYSAFLSGYIFPSTERKLTEHLQLLRDVGVVANMHTVHPPKPIEDWDFDNVPTPTDPIRCAEYAGGQILAAAAMSDKLGPPDRALLAEFETKTDGVTSSYELGLHPDVDVFLSRHMIIEHMRTEVLDCQPEDL